MVATKEKPASRRQRETSASKCMMSGNDNTPPTVVNTPRSPSDPDAELRVIEGAFVPGGMEKALKIVTATDFATIGGKKIFSAMVVLHKTGRPISIGILEASMQADPDFSRILTVLDSMAPFTAEGVTHFSKIVRELSIRRQLMALAATAVEDLADITIPIPEAAGDFVGVYGEGESFLKGGPRV